MRKLLVTLGCWDEVDHKAFAGRLARDEVQCYDGAPLPPELVYSFDPCKIRRLPREKPLLVRLRGLTGFRDLKGFQFL